nr:immunoglobulin light chain junction region [Macaca mulatta]MOX97853.1 immunoglobulin light chain junction region [Macaca mulatta]MOY04092.1 immunoglobulin light chain junction region [Macaca mulatta]MOY04497.1 immunoglobulin light chain junction region [Macaca mulatta]
CLQYNSLPWTF